MTNNLFSCIHRSDLRPAIYGEHPFFYLDLSARLEADDVRNFLEEAFNNYPSDESEELKKRIQGANIVHCKSAIYELLLHELLIRMGLCVTVHPEIKYSSKRPDFLVTSKSGWSLYLEAVHISELGNKRGILENQKNNLYNEINKQFIGTFASLSISIIKQAETNFRRSDLLNDIKLNLEKLQTTHSTHIHWRWESKNKDWCIELKLYKHNDAPRRFISCIYPYMAVTINTHRVIKKAFEKKSTKYGKLDLPLILAINIDVLILDTIDEIEGLFGKEQFIFTDEGVEFAGRQKNGAWYGHNGPRNTRVSGAWLFHNLTEWRLNKRHFLYLNPYANQPINEDFYSLIPYVRAISGKLERKDGQQIFELLGLNWEWIKY